MLQKIIFNKKICFIYKLLKLTPKLKKIIAISYLYKNLIVKVIFFLE